MLRFPRPPFQWLMASVAAVALCACDDVPDSGREHKTTPEPEVEVDSPPRGRDGSGPNPVGGGDIELSGERVSQRGAGLSALGMVVPLFDHEAVALVRPSGEIDRLVDLGSAPVALEMVTDTVVAVVAEDSDALLLIDMASAQAPFQLHLGGTASSVSVSGGLIAVALRDKAEVVLVNAEAGEVQARIALPVELPRHVLLTSSKIITSHEGPHAAVVITPISGGDSEVVELNATAIADLGEVIARVTAPTLVGGDLVVVQGIASTSVTGDGDTGGDEGSAEGYAASNHGVVEVLVDAGTGTVDVFAFQPGEAFPLETVLVHEDVFFFREGNTLQGFGVVGERFLELTVELSPGVTSVGIDPVSATVYAYDPLLPAVQTWALLPDGPGDELFASAVSAGDALLPVAIDPAVYRGRLLFHDTSDPRISSGGLACVSCHPGGGTNGTRLEEDDTLFNTMPIWGGISQTAPLHWRNDVETFAAINEITIVGRMGGTGLDEDEMDDLLTYIDTLRPPAAPVRDPALVAVGQAIFESPETGCTGCHSGEMKTDGQLHLLPDHGDIQPFATPPLVGLAFTAPYMMDGRAFSLRDVVEDWVLTDKMGMGSHLDASDVDALVAYLETL